MQSSQLDKLGTSCRTRTRVKLGKKSTPRANRLSYEFTWMCLYHLSINPIGLISIPFQYFTYFDDHKLTGVMVTSHCVMFTYRSMFSLVIPVIEKQYYPYTGMSGTLAHANAGCTSVKVMQNIQIKVILSALEQLSQNLLAMVFSYLDVCLCLVVNVTDARCVFVIGACLIVTCFHAYIDLATVI